jgi:hypothetical protein
MEKLLETLDKDALFVSPIASPIAGEKVEAKILTLTQKCTERLKSDETEESQKRSQRSWKSHPKRSERVNYAAYLSKTRFGCLWSAWD